MFTSDPVQSEIQLVVSGSVIKFADIQPKYVRLYGTVGAAIRQSVTITPESEYPFKIVDASAQNGRQIRFELKEEGSAGQVRYVLTVENTKTEAGRYYDTIHLKTDSSVKPKISISVYGRIIQPDQRKRMSQPRRG